MAWRQDPRYVEVRYEDLVADPVRAMRAVCEAIGARADGTWLEALSNGGRRQADAAEIGTQRPDYGGAVSASSVGRWRTDLSADEQRLVARLCGSRLGELGYATS
jgi:hypothetical protein